MSNAYKANLVGNRLEWVDEAPHLPIGSASTPVLVTILPPAELTTKEMRRRRVAALERIAARGGIQSIPDPVAWQREMREDRPLRGRDD